MKKLIKSGVCEIVNSSFMHCSQKTGQQLRLKKKKKRKCRRST